MGALGLSILLVSHSLMSAAQPPPSADFLNKNSGLCTSRANDLEKNFVAACGSINYERARQVYDQISHYELLDQIAGAHIDLALQAFELADLQNLIVNGKSPGNFQAMDKLGVLQKECRVARRKNIYQKAKADHLRNIGVLSHFTDSTRMNYIKQVAAAYLDMKFIQSKGLGINKEDNERLVALRNAYPQLNNDEVEGALAKTAEFFGAQSQIVDFVKTLDPKIGEFQDIRYSYGFNKRGPNDAVWRGYTRQADSFIFDYSPLSDVGGFFIPPETSTRSARDEIISKLASPGYKLPLDVRQYVERTTRETFESTVKTMADICAESDCEGGFESCKKSLCEYAHARPQDFSALIGGTGDRVKQASFERVLCASCATVTPIDHRSSKEKIRDGVLQTGLAVLSCVPSPLAIVSCPSILAYTAAKSAGRAWDEIGNLSDAYKKRAFTKSLVYAGIVSSQDLDEADKEVFSKILEAAAATGQAAFDIAVPSLTAYRFKTGFLFLKGKGVGSGDILKLAKSSRGMQVLEAIGKACGLQSGVVKSQHPQPPFFALLFLPEPAWASDGCDEAAEEAGRIVFRLNHVDGPLVERTAATTGNRVMVSMPDTYREGKILADNGDTVVVEFSDGTRRTVKRASLSRDPEAVLASPRTRTEERPLPPEAKAVAQAEAVPAAQPKVTGQVAMNYDNKLFRSSGGQEGGVEAELGGARFSVATENGVPKPGTAIGKNEDAFVATVDPQGNPVFVVVDGMGGHGGGEVAAHIIAKNVGNDVKAGISVKQSIEALPAKIKAAADHGDGAPNMGAVFVSAKVDKANRQIEFTHTGDARGVTYGRNGVVGRTEDHAAVNGPDMKEFFGGKTEEQLLNDPAYLRMRNMVSHAVTGNPQQLKVTPTVVKFSAGDRTILASDGVWDNITTKRVGEIIASSPSPGEAQRRVIEEAIQNMKRYKPGTNSAFKPDNVTALVIFH